MATAGAKGPLKPKAQNKTVFWQASHSNGVAVKLAALCKAGRIARYVIDEAHYILNCDPPAKQSSKKTPFRPQYRQLGEELGRVHKNTQRCASFVWRTQVSIIGWAPHYLIICSKLLQCASPAPRDWNIFSEILSICFRGCSGSNV